MKRAGAALVISLVGAAVALNAAQHEFGGSLSVGTWESDAFAFLDAHLGR